MAACAAAMACAASANAGVIFSSIPDLSAAPIGDWNATIPYTVAGAFTLTEADTLRAVDFAADLASDTAFQGVELFSDNGGMPGEVLLGTGGWTFTDLANARLFSASLSNLTLGAGTYWLGVTGLNTGIEGFAGSGTMVQCHATVCTPTGQTMGFALFGDPADGAPIGSLTVPEPSTWAILLLGMFGLGAALRRSTGSHPRRIGCARSAG